MSLDEEKYKEAVNNTQAHSSADFENDGIIGDLKNSDETETKNKVFPIFPSLKSLMFHFSRNVWKKIDIA